MTTLPRRAECSGGDLMIDGVMMSEREVVDLLAEERAIYTATEALQTARARFITRLETALSGRQRWDRAASYAPPAPAPARPHYDEHGWRSVVPVAS